MASEVVHGQEKAREPANENGRFGTSPLPVLSSRHRRLRPSHGFRGACRSRSALRLLVQLEVRLEDGQDPPRKRKHNSLPAPFPVSTFLSIIRGELQANLVDQGSEHPDFLKSRIRTPAPGDWHVLWKAFSSVSPLPFSSLLVSTQLTVIEHSGYNTQGCFVELSSTPKHAARHPLFALSLLWSTSQPSVSGSGSDSEPVTAIQVSA